MPMGSHSPNYLHVPDTSSSPSSTTRLSLLISRTTTPPDSPPLPPHTAVSVPFKWEESPGKPRLCHTQSGPKEEEEDIYKTLELPPRLLLLDGPSPTTVLGGPYVGRAVSFSSSYRTPRDNWASNFGSARLSSFRKVTKEDDEGIFDFSGHKLKMTTTRNSVPRRRSSSLGLSHQSKAASHFWASIYESFKQMVPWKRRHEKQRKKWASKVDTV